MIEDRLLIWRFKRGSREAMRRIYEKYRVDLLKVAVVLTGDVGTAEDVVQDVFVAFAAASPEKIGIRGSLKAFLMTCTLNRIRNCRRDRLRHDPVGLDQAHEVVAGSARPDQWAVLSEQLEHLRRAMADLPDEQREVITLRMEADMTFRQIAGLQETSIRTIQGRYRYGIEKLRSKLDSEVEQ